MSSALVTGGNGLIGGRLVAALAGSRDLYALVRRMPQSADPRVNWVVGDLSVGAALDGLPGDIDTVVHLAQSAKFRDFPGSAMDVFNVNCASTARLLDWCVGRGVKRFILGSSGSVYVPSRAPHAETDAVRTAASVDIYSASKLCAEFVAGSYRSELAVLILRFFFVYGAEQGKTMLIPRLVESVASGKPIQLQGADGLRINPIHVDDAVRGISRCTELRQSETINIAGPDTLSLRQIGEAIGERVGRMPRFEVAETADPPAMIGDTAKMTELLGAPRIAFADGVGELCEALGGAPVRGTPHD